MPKPKVVLIIILACVAFGAIVSCTDPVAEHVRLSTVELEKEAKRFEGLMKDLEQDYAIDAAILKKKKCTTDLKKELDGLQRQIFGETTIDQVSDERLVEKMPLSGEIIDQLSYQFLQFETCVSSGSPVLCPLFDEPWFIYKDSLSAMFKANSFGGNYLFFQNLELECNVCGYKSMRAQIDN